MLKNIKKFALLSTGLLMAFSLITSCGDDTPTTNSWVPSNGSSISSDSMSPTESITSVNTSTTSVGVSITSISIVANKYQVSGRVIDHKNNPVSNVNVILTLDTDSSVTFSSNTNKEGIYSFVNLEGGNYSLKAIPTTDDYTKKDDAEFPKVSLSGSNYQVNLEDIVFIKSDIEWGGLN